MYVFTTFNYNDVNSLRRKEELEDETVTCLSCGGEQEKQNESEIFEIISHCRIVGFVSGFLLQLISLAARCLITLEWTGNDGIRLTSQGCLAYFVLWCWSHIFWVVWPIVWMTPFVFSRTERGKRKTKVPCTKIM